MIVFILFLSFITIETTLLPTDLLKGYDKRVHPYFINYQPLLVNFSVPSLNLQQFFGTQLMASFLYVVVVRWQDERLRFDPTFVHVLLACGVKLKQDRKPLTGGAYYSWDSPGANVGSEKHRHVEVAWTGG
ncbi:unnamed protein product, partial [Mesorhabditis belari]|uniref:Uncharacterized protein n=1 Tax=Mesorhabditis belari TaxID=2138241 RepID=A0AAF3EEI2_9BILA